MKTDPLTIQVEYSVNFQGEETPLRFFIGGKAVEIEEIVDRWLGSDYSYFKVHANGNDLYILRHDELTQEWELTMFKSGKYSGDAWS